LALAFFAGACAFVLVRAAAGAAAVFFIVAACFGCAFAAAGFLATAVVPFVEAGFFGAGLAVTFDATGFFFVAATVALLLAASFALGAAGRFAADFAGAFLLAFATVLPPVNSP